MTNVLPFFPVAPKPCNTDQTFKRVPWSAMHKHMMREWKQGQHVSLLGPTGVGKTVLLSEILKARSYNVVFVSKVHDDSIGDFKGYERITKWPPKLNQNKVLLWPEHEKTIEDTIKKQHDVFGDAFNRIFVEGNWTVAIDEQHYCCNELGLALPIRTFLHQGRSSGLTVVNGSQRPAWIPLVTLSGSRHAFVWKNTMDEDLKRLANLGGFNRKEMEPVLLNLEEHEFMYIDTRKGISVRSQVER